MASQQSSSLNLQIPYRGEILTQDNYALAINKKWPFVYAVPKEIQDPEILAVQLSNLLEIDQEIILKKLNKPDDPHELLKNNISDDLKSQIQDLNLPGIKIGYNWSRYYPGENLASQIIGFVSEKGGQYGLEQYFNKSLYNGQDLELTLDYTIQFFVEEQIKNLVEQYQAKFGSVIIMNPETGALISMASYPNFNPNHYNKSEDIALFLNPVVNHVFEPGSVFKPITMVIGLNNNKITPETIYFDTGERIIDDYAIHNWDLKSYGYQTMTEVLEKSLNTGVIFAQEQIGKQDFFNYIKDFGFGFKTGISLPNEQKGDLSNLKIQSNINYATASYGQGISVTPLQLITAISAIANNGKLMQPHIIKQETQEVRQVISPQASWQICKMLKSVFASGNLKNFGLDGYEVAGKTGTAQIPEAGSYAENKSIHTLVGFLPDNPEFVILIKLDEPIGVRWSATSLPPTFQAILKFLINYYQISPRA